MAFTEQTFELLGQLKSDGTYKFYQDNEADFQKHLVQPFKTLLTQEIVPRLPAPILQAMETQRRLFGQINRNDFGRGGAHPFYWGAPYPNRSQSRQQDFQLLTFIEEGYLEYGFFQGWHTSEERQRLFRDNCRRLTQAPQEFEYVLEFMDEFCPAEDYVIRNLSYADAEYELSERGSRVHKEWCFSWKVFLTGVAKSPIEDIKIWSPMVVLPPETLMPMSMADLGAEIAEAFQGLYALMLLATAQLPFPALHLYIESIRQRTVV